MSRSSTPLPWSSEEERLLVLQRLRWQLRDDGQLPDGLVPPIIGASWRRSLAYGITPKQTDADIFSVPRTSHEQLRALLHECATPEIDFLAQQYSPQGAILLADAQAHILRFEGRMTPHLHARTPHIGAGMCCGEATIGTNALGTALVECRSIQVNSGEHFLDGLSHLSCTAVPIHNSRGDLVGAINLAREGPLHNADALNMLAMAVQNIEARLLCKSHDDMLVVALQSQSAFLNSPWCGLLAIDPLGVIRGANTHSCTLLGLPVSALIDHSSECLLGITIEALSGVLMRASPYEFHSSHGAIFLKAVQWPGRPMVKSASVREKVIAASRVAVDSADPWRSLLQTSPPALARQLQAAQRAMGIGVPVLLHGATGTGKEVVAQALHAASARASQPCVAVNCAAIPEGLIEAELFGYRDGAFTGSRKGGSAGRLVRAQGGTLFLDEIGDMPLALQARLLRVLQERRVTPLGGGSEIALDFALICATHRDLERMVREHGFREDLYYRIKGAVVALPALREREDFEQIVQLLLQRLGALDVSIGAPLMALLRQHAWPGNIRQLEMVLRTALALRQDHEQVLTPEHLSADFRSELQRGKADPHPHALASSISFPASAAPPPEQTPLNWRLNEQQLIRAALAQQHGNVSAAAKALGMSRATLYRKMEQLNS